MNSMSVKKARTSITKALQKCGLYADLIHIVQKYYKHFTPSASALDVAEQTLVGCGIVNSDVFTIIETYFDKLIDLYMVDYNAVYVESAARFLYDDLEQLKHHFRHEKEILRNRFHWTLELGHDTERFIVFISRNRILLDLDETEYQQSGWFKSRWYKHKLVGPITGGQKNQFNFDVLEPITSISPEFENTRQCTILNYYGNNCQEVVRENE